MMESDWFGSKMLWRVVQLLDVRQIFTAPYFPLSRFLIPVLTRYKAGFFWYLAQKHHLDQFRLSHPDTLVGS